MLREISIPINIDPFIRFKSFFINFSKRKIKRKRRENNSLYRKILVCIFQDEMRNMDKVSWIPVYVVPDSSCLSLSLRHIQRLLACKKFVFVVPTATITALDIAKKHSVKAREASRWLEFRLDEGNKFLRAQKSSESVCSEAALKKKMNKASEIRER